jgi:aminoglycoside phosphotransferase (APT) family kinase protein
VTDQPVTDQPTEVRTEDAVDVDALTAWLAEHADVPAGLPEVRQFPGGASNLTYLLRYPDGEAGRELILRRPPTGAKARGAHDMRREFTIQSRLAPVFDYVPQMVAFCDDPAVLGSDFYVMTRLEGTILRRDLPPGLTLTTEEAETLCTGFLDVLVELHQVDPGAAGLDDLGRGSGYVTRQVGGWSDRFRAARTDNVGDFEAVMAWLDREQPADVGTCVIHNDFRLDNVVLAPSSETPVQPTAGSTAGRVVGVLDWEMATLGDPLMDLAGAMAYWIQADDDPDFQAFRRQPSHLPGMLSRSEMVDYYTAARGLSVSADQWRFYEVFGLFRLAVIAQQIYFRYHHGQTTNEAYARFLPVVQYLERRCGRLVGG